MKRSPSGMFWPVFVVCILLVSVGVCGVTVYAAVSDPSYAVEPDYYEQASRWDQLAKERAASDALGVSATVSVSMPRPPSGEREVRVSFFDEEGQAYEPDVVTALVFHHARRHEARELTLTRSAEGGYAAVIPGAHAGVWQVRLRAVRAGEVFLDTQDVTTPDGGRR